MSVTIKYSLYQIGAIPNRDFLILLINTKMRASIQIDALVIKIFGVKSEGETYSSN